MDPSTDTEAIERGFSIIRSRRIWCKPNVIIENGAVVIQHGLIRQVGLWPEIKTQWSCPVIDLGEGLLLPGLVNLHTHVEYSSIGARRPSSISFVEWLEWITSQKYQFSPDNISACWKENMLQFMDEGVTTIVDTISYWNLLDGVSSLGNILLPFLEFIGPDLQPKIEARFQQFIWIIRYRKYPIRGLAPHAPYTIAPSIAKYIGEAAASRNLLISVHVAESIDEEQLFIYKKGALLNWLWSRGFELAWLMKGVSPVEYLSCVNLLTPSTILVHANYVREYDIKIISKAKAIVVHCPGTHEYFQRDEFPIDLFMKYKIPVALGTDSLATQPIGCNKLSLLTEAARFYRSRANWSPEEVLALITTVPGSWLAANGIKVGLIEPTAKANMIFLPTNLPYQEAFGLMFEGRIKPSKVFVNGSCYDVSSARRQ